jgi:uncharacterized protein (TIGR01777 family)
MKHFITGGTGFIGRHLCRQLLSQGHVLTVLTRNPDTVKSLFGVHKVTAITDLQEWKADQAYDAVINLAGEPIMARRWSESRKRILWGSRVSLTQRLIECMARAKTQPSVFISGSAIGIYGDQGDAELDESSPGGGGFGHRLCRAWEAAAQTAGDSGIRVCLLRTGLVVGRQGGFLKQMLLPFRLGLGGRLGSGRQWMSWVHLDDHVRMTQFLLDSQAACGVYNVTAPNPVTNAEFTRLLAEQLHRPALIPLPAPLLKLAAGEMSELLLGSQRVLPRKAVAQGFKFNFETLEPALKHALSRQA